MFGLSFSMWKLLVVLALLCCKLLFLAQFSLDFFFSVDLCLDKYLIGAEIIQKLVGLILLS